MNGQDKASFEFWPLWSWSECFLAVLIAVLVPFLGAIIALHWLGSWASDRIEATLKEGGA